MEMSEYFQTALAIRNGTEPAIDAVFYWQLIRNNGALARHYDAISYNGKLIRSETEFQKACENEGWSILVQDGEKCVRL